MMREYRKWLLLKTAREERTVRVNECLASMHRRAVIVRRKAVLDKVAAIRFRANPVMPRLKVPSVVDE